jgi:hypothetical protein
LQNFSFATATAEKRSFTARRAKNCKSLCKSNRLLQQARNINNNDFEPSLDKPIDVNYSNNEIHRAFFKNTIGEQFKFNVKFMEWMEKNKGKKTYEQAIEMYKKILMDKKSGKKEKIGKQFEYNQYTRDFFENNPKSSMEDCIKCWNYKKKQIGNHKYGKDDLKILETCFYSKNTQKPSK